MKLNYKRTILVGFAFFLISAFWQAYDATIPVILTNKFGMDQFWSGVIMALDNILAVFMLPLFGAISDKCLGNKYGKRTPFITIGTIIAAVALILLSFADTAQLKNISEVAKQNDPAAMSVIYDTQKDKELMTPEGDTYYLKVRYPDKAQFVSIVSEYEVLNIADPLAIMKKVNADIALYDDGVVNLSAYDTAQFDALIAKVKDKDDQVLLRKIYNSGLLIRNMGGKGYIFVDGLTQQQIDDFSDVLAGKDATKFVTNQEFTDFVVPARQGYAADRTAANKTPLVFFVLLLFVVLIAMAIFRSPAVALMPDVTIKPLRSKANAIINLMGTAGGIIVLLLGNAFATSAVRNQLMSYTLYYLVIALLMLGALAMFLWQVKEKKWAEEMEDQSRMLGIEEDDPKAKKDKTAVRKLSGPEVRSLLLILASVALWYFGYNAVTSKYSVYASNVLNMDYNMTLLIAQGAAIVSYLPAGIVASKIGRKKTILAGVVMLTAAFAAASFLRSGSSVLVMDILFALAGIGWATINVNSFPMVVEMCSGGDVGKYTGYYYTASMSAQIVTPMLSGALMRVEGLGMTVLFPYAAIFAGLAFVTMFFVRHGDAKPEAKKGLEALDND